MCIDYFLYPIFLTTLSTALSRVLQGYIVINTADNVIPAFLY